MAELIHRLKIHLIIGTRPEAIKMAPVYFALRDSEGLDPVLISTGQHREMLDSALSVFGLKPDHDLGLMVAGQTLTDLTARTLSATGALFERDRPAAVLVQGDTTTVLASGLAAFYQKIPVGHVEAGLRTYDFTAPWPEEMNRRLIDPISRWCFAPTQGSADNLIGERIPVEAVHVTGNTVIDSLLWVRDKLRREGVTAVDVAQRCGIPQPFVDGLLGDDARSPRKFILITGHRRESFGRGFEDICQSILAIAEKYPDVGLLYPVHLNPAVQEPVNRLLGNNSRVALIPPVDYQDFIWLMDRCHFVLSDSGGVQEEAPSLGKPVLVMRETTERPEGVEAGTCRLVGTDPAKILREASVLLDDPAEYDRRSQLKNPYGDGKAAQKIVDILRCGLSGSKF